MTYISLLIARKIIKPSDWSLRWLGLPRRNSCCHSTSYSASWMALALSAWLILGVNQSRSLAATISLHTVADLKAVHVGETIVVGVLLGDLTPNERLQALSVALEINSQHFKAIEIKPGEILPNPLADQDDFLSFVDSTGAEGTFLTLSNNASEQISTTGAFYRVELSAQAPGQGAIRVAFADGLIANPVSAGQPFDLVIPLLPEIIYTIVPEPYGLRRSICFVLTTVLFSLRHEGRKAKLLHSKAV